MRALPEIPFLDGYLIGGCLGKVHFVNDVAFWVLRELEEEWPHQLPVAAIRKFQNRFGGSESEAIDSINTVLRWHKSNGLNDADQSEHTELNDGCGKTLSPDIGSRKSSFNKATLEINGISVALAVEETALFDLLQPMIAHLSKPAAVGSSREVVLAGRSENGRYELYRDGRLESIGLNMLDARHMVLEGMTLASVPGGDCFAVLHAAAVRFKSAGILIFGPSGAGKTTLSLNLIADGAEFISDDLVPLVGANAQAISMPFAIGVKHGSFKLGKSLSPEFDKLDRIRLGMRIVKYVRPDHENVRLRQDPQSIDLVIMPKYSLYEPPQVRDLSPLEALTCAAEVGSWFSAKVENMPHLAKFFERTHTVAVQYRSSNEALNLVRNLVKRRTI